MVLDPWVKTDDSLSTRLTATLEQVIEPQARGVQDSDAFFSKSFIQRHTEFESLDEFCRTCPCERPTIGGVQRLSADERNEFVDATTEFETWSEMKESAAVADIVTLAIP